MSTREQRVEEIIEEIRESIKDSDAGITNDYITAYERALLSEVDRLQGENERLRARLAAPSLPAGRGWRGGRCMERSRMHCPEK